MAVGTRRFHRSSTRTATASDLPLLQSAVVDAAFPPSPRPPVDEALRAPHVARMIDDWPRPGDAGVIAMRGRSAVGAAWYRLFDPEELRSQYAEPDVPELAIAIARHHRGQGWGGVALDALVECASTEGRRALDLQVGLTNRVAIRLYERTGFERVGDPEDDLVWMRKQIQT
ncbi:MAG TPA: GNAT family N-acetyltransferase [Acidimicrobiia bacterium]|jgi:GNAT superfamily N-acetyltransferase